MRTWLAILVTALVCGSACRRTARPAPAEPLETAFRPAGRSAIEERGRRIFG
jgi:hypothetical protein